MRRAFILTLLCLLIAASACTPTRATGNNVASSAASDTSGPVTANQLKPSECDALNLTAVIVSSSDDFEGDAPNELLLGSPGSQRIRGRDGDDCIVGGAGTDEIRGDAGTDVCIGSSDSDFQDCETTVIRP